jgi:hypothetical protein
MSPLLTARAGERPPAGGQLAESDVVSRICPGKRGTRGYCVPPLPPRPAPATRQIGHPAATGPAEATVLTSQLFR